MLRAERSDFSFFFFNVQTLYRKSVVFTCGGKRLKRKKNTFTEAAVDEISSLI